jgi:hypothetical protein
MLLVVGLYAMKFLFLFMSLNLCVTVAQCDRISTFTKQYEENICKSVVSLPCNTVHTYARQMQLSFHHFGNIFKSTVSISADTFQGICWAFSVSMVVLCIKSRDSPLLDDTSPHGMDAGVGLWEQFVCQPTYNRNDARRRRRRRRRRSISYLSISG